MTIHGTLDERTSPDARAVFDGIVADNRQRVTVDLSGLELLDRGGVASLLSLRNQIRSNGGAVHVTV